MRGSEPVSTRGTRNGSLAWRVQSRRRINAAARIGLGANTQERFGESREFSATGLEFGVG
jgi:hypothetical protein